MKRLLFCAAMLFLCAATAAQAARHEPDPDFSIDVPNDWETARGNFSSRVPQSVSAVFECVDANPALPLIMVGWKTAPNGLGAFCVSYRRSGGGKTLNLLKASRGKSRDDAFGKFADIFASSIHAGYQKRKIVIEDMAADLLSAAENVIMVLDGKIKSGGKIYMRSDTVILHNDAILNVSTLYEISSPSLLIKQVDELPLSTKWKH